MALKRREFIRRLAAFSLCMLAAGSGTAHAQAADYPDRPITLIYPGPPGDVGDVVARIMAEGLARELGGNVIVENKPGASRMIGISQAARAKPDGYTALFTDVSLVLNPHLFSNVTYDPFKDFIPVSETGTTPVLLVVHSSVPATTIEEFVALAKARPGHYTYASNGNGTPLHMYGEMLSEKSGIDMLHVPFQGGAQMMSGLLGGQVHLSFTTLSSAWAHIQAGKLRPLAITGTRRAALVPDVPTFPEVGFPDFSRSGWQSVLLPAGTPPELVERWEKALKVVAADPEVARRMLPIGVEPVGSTSEEFAKTMQVDSDRWADWVKRFGVQLN
jgi:tripartite-type tricarboxylate transporter receptor subunit TctC